MQDYGKLDKLLKDKKNYTMEELCNSLNKNEYKIRQDLLNYLYTELDKINIEHSKKKYKNIYKVFKYFENVQTNKEKEQILTGLKKTTKLCNSKIKNKKIDGKDNIYVKVLNIIEVTLLNLSCNNIVENEELNNYKLIKYIIFDLKNYNYLFELIKTFPKYLTASNDGITIFEEIVNSYIQHVSRNDFSSDLIYLEKVIKLFVNTDKFKLDKYSRLKIMKKIKENLKNNSKKSVFFLNELINDINKINAKKDINELFFKYDIHKNNDEDYIYSSLNIDTLGTVDLRGKHIITIDKANTQVFDDACAIDRINDEEYLLSVFVADVASYVPRDSIIDKVAYEKSETLYMPKQVITMLPPGLTRNLTLKAGCDRQAIGLFFLLDNDMQIKNFNVRKCLINVNKNYSYNEVTKSIMNGNNINELKMFNDMADVALKLHDNKIRQNYREIKSIKNNNDYNISIGDTIIVEFMTLTNYYIASIFNELENIPFIYRINTGTYGDDIKKEMYKLLGESIKTKEIQRRFNRLCPPSIYSDINLGHSGLNLESYCHSTNPLRNYASLECQRLIIEHLINKDQNIDLEQERKYIKQLCEYMNNRINLNKTFLEECHHIKIKNIY